MKLMSEASAEKLRGGFYTPAPIASFILKWGINGSKDYNILEPSCGDGVFLEQLKKNKLKYAMKIFLSLFTITMHKLVVHF